MRRLIIIAMALIILSGERSVAATSTLNPDTSLNLLILGLNSSRGNNAATAQNPQAVENGLTLQEAELQFFSDVDPYWRMNGLFSVHQERSVDSGGTLRREWKFEPEEVFAETLSLPVVSLRIGQFKAALGRHGQLHTHAFPFIDAPLFQAKLVGADGLSDVGISAATLLPFIPWYSEFILQIISGRSESLGDIYGNSSPNSSVQVARLKNLWDVGDSTTVELGLSGATGRNQFEKATDFFGADFTVKWRPTVFGATRALIWSTEALSRQLRQSATIEYGQGFATWLQAQLALKWWIQYRAEYLEQKGILSGTSSTDAFSRKQSALIGFVPTEFSAIRAQFDSLTDQVSPAEQRISLQFNYTIGAHPAHQY